MLRDGSILTAFYATRQIGRLTVGLPTSTAFAFSSCFSRLTVLFLNLELLASLATHEAREFNVSRVTAIRTSLQRSLGLRGRALVKL